MNEHHVIEDLEGQWLEDVHEEPLARYFAAQLVAAAPSGEAVEAATMEVM